MKSLQLYCRTKELIILISLVNEDFHVRERKVAGGENKYKKTFYFKSSIGSNNRNSYFFSLKKYIFLNFVPLKYIKTVRKLVAMNTPYIQIVESKSLKESVIRDVVNSRSREDMHKLSQKGLMSESKEIIKDQ